MDLFVSGLSPKVQPHYHNSPVRKSPFSMRNEREHKSVQKEIPVLSNLTEEQKDTILQAWNALKNQDTANGTGRENWKRFLSSLKDSGIISEDECILAGGGESLVVALPKPDKDGRVFVFHEGIPQEDENDQIEMLNADPLKWLDYFIFYQSKFSEIAKRNSYDTNGISEQISACRKVQSIVDQFQQFQG